MKGHNHYTTNTPHTVKLENKSVVFLAGAALDHLISSKRGKEYNVEGYIA